MSLGMGIFLSSLVLGPIVLIIGTKDRWNWKKIIFWPFAGLILIALGLWIYNTIKERPKVQTSFWDIPLGATESDVKFLKAAPIVVVSQTKDKDTWEYVFKTGSGYFVANEKTGEKAWWDGKNLYPVNSSSKVWDYIYHVGFKNGRVWLIEYFPGSGRTYRPGIQGIDIGDSLEKITQKFGLSSSVSVSNDELSRAFSFKDYRVFFTMKENRVETYGVFDPAIAPSGVEYPKDYFDLLAEKDRREQTKRTTLINKSNR